MKNYPFAWQGLYKVYTEGCSMVLELVVNYDLWVW
jgi:hypothetical protein